MIIFYLQNYHTKNMKFYQLTITLDQKLKFYPLPRGDCFPKTRHPARDAGSVSIAPTPNPPPQGRGISYLHSNLLTYLLINHSPYQLINLLNNFNSFIINQIRDMFFGNQFTGKQNCNPRRAFCDNFG